MRLACLPLVLSLPLLAQGSEVPLAFNLPTADRLQGWDLGVAFTHRFDTPVKEGGRDAGGLYAMTSLCTHLQCDLNTLGTIGATGVRCGCHGSQFDLVGNVTGGPASSPLRHYRLTLECDGSLRVDVSMVVAQDARLVA